MGLFQIFFLITMDAMKLCVFFFMTITVCYCDVEDIFLRKKCFDELGCFDRGKPFFDILKRPLSLLPNDREKINTQFILFTPGKNQLNFSSLNFSIDDLAENNFDPNLKTRFIILGFMTKISAEKNALEEALLRMEPSNVFLVDWSGGDGLIYEQAVANTRVVGAEIALLLKKIQDKFELKLETVHLIGHSLGAHAAGYAGKRLNKIGRITALDPAGPYFREVDPVVRLDKSDALLVDAIHTNAASHFFQGFGLSESIAHFDFWPNGGHVQPGCPDLGSSIWSFLKHPTLDFEGLKDITCNHGRSIDLFLSTIKFPDCEMYGVACDSWEDYTAGKCNSTASKSYLMGIHADKNAENVNQSESMNLYLNTAEKEPFCEK